MNNESRPESRLRKNLRRLSGRSKKNKQSATTEPVKEKQQGAPPPPPQRSYSTSGRQPTTTKAPVRQDNREAAPQTARPSGPDRLKSAKSPSFAQLISRRDQVEGVDGSNHPPHQDQSEHDQQEPRESEEEPEQDQAEQETPEKDQPQRFDSIEEEPPAAPSAEDQADMTSPAEESDDDFQLSPPPPKSSITTVEGLSELLFSEAHLSFLIQDPLLFTRFAQFLGRYKPKLLPILLHHLEILKATKALEYANAVASGLGPLPGDESTQGLKTAAAMNNDLDQRRQRVMGILMAEALPAQITFSLVEVVTDAMQKSIKGAAQTPIMRNLIGGLTEVFVLTDPSTNDNPIIYASEEFYRMTGYGRDYVINRNCRFLQGPKTVPASIHRLKQCIDDGVEISETLLNYRRDGTPFMNLLMVAPLHDNKGRIKYHIGAQVDVTGLVEEGQGLDGFDSFLVRKRRADAAAARGKRDGDEQNLALEKLGELAEMFDVAESAIVTSNSRSNSLTRDSGYGSSPQPKKGNNRRILIDESQSDDDTEGGGEEGGKDQDYAKWDLAPPSAATGELPGVYQKYMLLRPAPSIRIIFVSPALRELSSVLRKPLLESVSASKGTMSGLREAFESGAPVSAKVTWKDPHGNAIHNGQPYWIAATPMLGSDDNIGVWMLVVIDNQSGRPSKHTSARNAERPPTSKSTAGVSALPADNATTDAEAKSGANPGDEAAGAEAQHEIDSGGHSKHQDHVVGSDKEHGVAQHEQSAIQNPIGEEKSSNEDAKDGASETHISNEHHQGESEQKDTQDIPEAPTGTAGKEEEATEQDNRKDVTSESDAEGFGEHYMPVSQKIWPKPPRPSMPDRMLSID